MNAPQHINFQQPSIHQHINVPTNATHQHDNAHTTTILHEHSHQHFSAIIDGWSINTSTQSPTLRNVNSSISTLTYQLTAYEEHQHTTSTVSTSIQASTRQRTIAAAPSKPTHQCSDTAMPPTSTQCHHTHSTTDSSTSTLSPTTLTAHIAPICNNSGVTLFSTRCYCLRQSFKWFFHSFFVLVIIVLLVF